MITTGTDKDGKRMIVMHNDCACQCDALVFFTWDDEAQFYTNRMHNVDVSYSILTRIGLAFRAFFNQLRKNPEPWEDFIFDKETIIEFAKEILKEENDSI